MIGPICWFTALLGILPFSTVCDDILYRSPRIPLYCHVGHKWTCPRNVYRVTSSGRFLSCAKRHQNDSHEAGLPLRVINDRRTALGRHSVSPHHKNASNVHPEKTERMHGNPRPTWPPSYSHHAALFAPGRYEEPLPCRTGQAWLDVMLDSMLNCASQKHTNESRWPPTRKNQF